MMLVNCSRLILICMLLSCQESHFSGKGSISNENSDNPLASDSPIFKECDDGSQLPLVADLYQLPNDTQRLPDFSTMQAIKTICIAQLNISNREFSRGFPGVENLFEWFGLVIRFRVDVPTDGIYTLSVNSDDGSKTFVDGKEILTMDGLQPATERKADVVLSAGMHDFRIEYFQGPRYAIALELFWQTPLQQEKIYIPEALLKRPQD